MRATGMTFLLLAVGACAGAPEGQLANGSFSAELNGFRIHYGSCSKRTAGGWGG